MSSRLLALLGILALTPFGAVAAPAPEPPAEAVLAELRFQPADEPNRVLVDLAPEGGERLVMMLDTGASTTVVTPLLARSLGVTVRRNKATPYRRSTRLGRDLQFYVDTRTSDTGSKTGWEYGLLGGEFMDDYVVEIDFPARKVRFLDPKKYEVPAAVDAPDERSLGFKLADTRILVPVEVDGKSASVLLDTGAPDNVILSGPTARRLGIDFDELPVFGKYGTVMGPMEVRLRETASFRLAGFDFEPLPLLIAPRGWYNMGPSDSVVGYDVLRHFVIRIDYPRKRLWLKRSGDRRITFLGADYATAKQLGAYLTAGGGAFHVWGVVPGGPAARYGLREGDAIVAPAGDEPLTLDEILRRIQAREELTVARRNGDVWVDTPLPDGEAAPAP
jgi:hypothetical protein